MPERFGAIDRASLAQLRSVLRDVLDLP